MSKEKKCKGCGENLKKKHCGLFLSGKQPTNEKVFACGNEKCGMLHDASGGLIVLNGKVYTETDMVNPPKK